MKWNTLGRAVLALAASAACTFGMTSCSRSYTVGYFFVTGAQYNQVSTYKIQNDTGQLHLTKTVGTGGYVPIQAIVSPGGNYLYILNAGCGERDQAPCSATQKNPPATPQPSQIDLFSIGGQGVLTHQQTFTSQGINTRNIVISGNYLYALDEFAPDNASGPQTIGAVTAFSVDSNTGRLTLVQNNQQKDANGLPLTYFPVGTNPTWLALGGSSAFIAEQGPAGGGTADDPSQAIFIYGQNTSNGQLTLTQSTPTPTGATQLTYLYDTGSVLYALDAGPTGSTGQILPYTVAANGGLSAIAPRQNNAQATSPLLPTRILKESSHNFLWVANSGVSQVNGNPASVITAYFIQNNNQLSDANVGGNFIPVGAGPSCIVEDPSNQYVYTANFNDSTITGKKIDQRAGGLVALPRAMPAAPGSPTWCTVSGSTF